MKIYWVRHGEAESNILNIFNEDPSKKFLSLKKELNKQRF